VADRELDVGQADFKEATLLAGDLECVTEQVVPLGRDGGKEASAVTEVMRWSAVRDADASRQLPQTEPVGTALGDHSEGRIEHGAAEVAVVVRPVVVLGHAPSYLNLGIDKFDYARVV
jgi:hypothetical protein